MRKCVGAIMDQPDTTEAWSIGLFATEPADHLSARVQHLDTCGYGPKELVAPDGLLKTFHMHIWYLVNAWADSTEHSQKLHTLLAHLSGYVGPEFDRQKCYNKFRAFTLTIGAAVWARIETL